MHLWVTGKSIQERGELDGGLERLFLPRGVLTFFALNDGCGKSTGAAPRQVAGESADLNLGDAQHLGDIGNGGAGMESIESANHGDMALLTALKDQVDHVILAVMGKVDIDIRQFIERHPVFVEESAEIKFKPDRANTADAQAVANQ